MTSKRTFLFTVIPERGHLNPMIPVAQCLQRDGHTVRFHAPANISDDLRRAGIDGFVGERAVAGDTEHAVAPVEGSRGAAFAERIRDAAWLRRWIKSLLLERVPAALPHYEAVVASHRPDVVVTDPMLYAAVIVAHRAKLPWAAVSNSLNPILHAGIQSELLDTVAWLADERAALFAESGAGDVLFRGCDALSPHLTTCFATEALCGGEVAGVALVGPSRPIWPRGDETPFPWERLSEARKKIYVSFGSQIYHQPARFNALIEATRALPVQLILSLNELLDDPALAPLPAEAIAVHYAPQLRLLEHVDLFITHGGANSVMEGLGAGVPLAIAPICNDQFHQRHFVEAARVGVHLPIESLTPSALQREIGAALANETLRDNARRMAASYAHNGAEVVARHLVRLAEGAPLGAHETQSLRTAGNA